jgi:hypothetical protein
MGIFIDDANAYFWALIAQQNSENADKERAVKIQQWYCKKVYVKECDAVCIDRQVTVSDCKMKSNGVMFDDFGCTNNIVNTNICLTTVDNSLEPSVYTYPNANFFLFLIFIAIVVIWVLILKNNKYTNGTN